MAEETSSPKLAEAHSFNYGPMYMEFRIQKLESNDLTLMSALQRVYDTLAMNVSDKDRRAAVQWFYNRNLTLS